MPRSPILRLQPPSPPPGGIAGTRRISPYRVQLIHPSSSTDKAVASLRTHPSTRKYLRFFPPHLSEDEVRKNREEAEIGEERYLFNVHIDSDSKDGVGLFGGIALLKHIDPLNSTCHAGIILAEEFQGYGLATISMYLLFQFAFEELGFHRIVLETGEDNLGMGGWIENVAGIRMEGVMKAAWKDPGTPDGWSDMMTYAVLEDEWVDRVKDRLAAKIGI